MDWSVETLNETVDAELEALPVDMRAKFARIAFLIESVGLEKVMEPHVKHLEGPLWEMRMVGRVRYFPGALRDSYRQTGCCCGAGIYQEKSENPAP